MASYQNLEYDVAYEKKNALWIATSVCLQNVCTWPTKYTLGVHEI